MPKIISWNIYIGYAQNGRKIKNALKLLKFGTFDISNMPISILMSKMIFIKYLFTTCLAQIGTKIINIQDLLKFGTYDISNITVSILMSKIIFIKYLPPVRPKLVLKTEVLRIYWSLAHLIFQIYRFQF